MTSGVSENEKFPKSGTPVVVLPGANAVVSAEEGCTFATPAEEMAAFDGLPRPLRRALAEAAREWSAVNVWARWRAAAARFGEARATRRGLRLIEEEEPGRADPP